MKLKNQLAAFVALTIMAIGKPALAATHVWSGAVNSYWSNPGNWSSGGVPAVFETSPVILDFPAAAPNHNSTNDIGASIFTLSVDQIVISGNNYVLGGVKGGTNLILTGYVGYFLPFSIYSSGTNNTFDYSLNCYFADTNVVNITQGANLAMDSYFSGPGGLTFTGPGTCVFNGAVTNDFTGTFNVQEGNVYLDNFFIWYGAYSANDADVPSLSGSLIVGMDGNSTPASLFVQRSQQFGTNCDITVNATGFIEFDRSSIIPSFDVYSSVQLNNEAHSLSVAGGSIYLGEVADRIYTPDNQYFEYYTNTTELKVDATFVATASPGAGQLPYVLGPGWLSLTGCAAAVNSKELFLSANSEAFKKSGPGTLSLFGGGHDNLTVAQGAAEVVDASVSFGGALCVSNGAQLDILKNCATANYAQVRLDLAGHGITGTGAALNVSNSVTFFNVADVTFHGDTSINVANSTDQLTLQEAWYINAVRGTNNLFKTGAGQIQFLNFDPNVPANGNTNGWLALSNIFSGTFYVNGGSAYFSSNSTNIPGGYALDGGIALGGPLVIGTNGGGSSCYVVLDGNRQLATNVPVTINPGCELELTGTNQQTFGALTLNGGTVSGGNVILHGDVTAQTCGVFYRPQIGPSAISLGGADRNLNVAASSALSLYGDITDGGAFAGITKTGPGELDFYGTNFCSGITEVSAGRLGGVANGAFSPSNYLVLVLTNAELALYDGVHIGAVPLLLVGSGEDGLGALKGYGTNSWGGVVTVTSNTVIGSITNQFYGPGQLELSGTISGSGGLTKSGGGVLLLDGFQANTYSGTTMVQRGLLALGKSGAQAVPGPLVVGPGTGAPYSVAVKWIQPGQLNPLAPVTVDSDGYLDLTAVNSGAAGSVAGSGAIALGFGATFTTGADDTSEIYSGAITGFGATLVKVGSGTWTVSGTSGLFGQLQVGAGKVVVDGYLGNASCVVSNAATLGGVGTVGALSALAGATIAPGHGPGILNSGSITLSPASILVIDLAATPAGTNYSQLNVTGTVTENTPLLQVQMTEAGGIGDHFTIINNDLADLVTGTFAALPEGATVTANTGAKFTISYRGGTGNDVVLTQVANAIPLAFGGLQALGNGTIKLSGGGVAGENYDVQCTTSLAPPNWATIATVMAASNGQITFIDTNAGASPARFYRLKVH